MTGPDFTEEVYLDGELKGRIGPSKLAGQGWHVQWPDRTNGLLVQNWATRIDAIEYLRAVMVPPDRRLTFGE